MKLWVLDILWQFGMLITGRARVVAKPNPARLKTCHRCFDYTPIFAGPCGICGCTGEAEYQRRVMAGR